MFFEPVLPDEERPPQPRPGLPAWYAPPAHEKGALVVSDLELARTPDVIIAVPTIRAFETGCLMNVDLVMRRHTLSPEDYQARQLSIWPHMVTGLSPGRPLPDTLLRFGVRFADGTKATTIGQRIDRNQIPQEPPPGPRLSWLFGGVSMRSGDEDTNAINLVGLWLWPLPPRESFELAVEWPAAGIGLSITTLDGSAIMSAAARSVPYWPA